MQLKNNFIKNKNIIHHKDPDAPQFALKLYDFLYKVNEKYHTGYYPVIMEVHNE